MMAHDTGSRRRHLLHVVRSFDPSGGGPAEGIRKLAETFSGSPAMELVSLDDPAAEFVRDQPLPVHALGPVGGHYGATPRLGAWLRSNLSRFEGVVIHGLWQYHSYGTYQAIQGHAIQGQPIQNGGRVGAALPYVIFPHGMLDPYFKRAFPLKHLKKQVYWMMREQQVLRRARAVCFTTAVERDCAVGTFWPQRWNSAVVSFGTAAPTGNPRAQRAAFLATFPRVTDRRFLLFLSRIHVKKGCDLAIQAFARVAAQHPDLDLVMAGPDEGGLQPKLAQLAADSGVGERVHWVGMLQGDIKWGAFYAAEAFVLPSHQENFGVAVVEAMACGVPVLISNQVNIWREVETDGAGIVGDDTLQGTFQSFSRYLALSPEQQQAMGAAGVECFRSRYQMEATARALNNLFDQP